MITPWHELGKVINTFKTPQEVLESIGADYDVELAELVTLDIEGLTPSIVTSKIKAIRRKDRKDKHIGYVKGVWRPIQNRDLFNKFEDQVKEKELRIEHAGVLDDGVVSYMLFKIRQDRKIWIGNSEILLYLLVVNCFDGETAIKIKPLIVRNLDNFTMYISPKGVKHSSITTFEVESTIKEGRVLYDGIIEKLNMMKGVKCDHNSYMNDVFIGSQNNKVIERIVGLSVNKASLYDWYCGIIEFINLHIGNYGQPVRMCKLWFGEHHKLCARALDYALRIVYHEA